MQNGHHGASFFGCKYIIASLMLAIHIPLFADPISYEASGDWVTADIPPFDASYTAIITFDNGGTNATNQLFIRDHFISLEIISGTGGRIFPSYAIVYPSSWINDFTSNANGVLTGGAVYLQTQAGISYFQLSSFDLQLTDCQSCPTTAYATAESAVFAHQATEPIPPGFSKSFTPDSVQVGQNSNLLFTIDNSAAATEATDLAFIDNLPASISVASPANGVNTCIGGTVTAVSGSNTISYTGGTVAANSICTLSVDVIASTPGVTVNTTGDLTSSAGNSGTATSGLTIEAAPLTIVATVAAGNGSVSCDPASVPAGGSSTCTAVPDAGWQVSGWTGACSAVGSSAICTLDNIQSDQISTVNFEAVPVTTYPIEFTVAGLLEGPTPGDPAYSVVLLNDGGDAISVFSDGTYSFPTELPNGASYDITIDSQPDNQTCSVTNESGTVASAPVTDPAVTCEDKVTPPVVAEAVPVPVDSRTGLAFLTMIILLLGGVALRNRP